MSSKRRLRKRSCSNKVAHDTVEAAQIARRKIRSGGYQVYKCKFCHKYHVGRHKGYKPFPLGKKRGATQR